MEKNYIRIINSIKHVVNNNGPLIIEYNKSVFTFDCVQITMKNIEKAAEQFKNCDFKEIIQTTDSSFLFK